MQTGGLSVHSPLFWQVLLSTPSNVNPSLQLYLARDPGLLPDRVTAPLVGLVSLGHRIATNEKKYSYSSLA